MPDLSDDPSPAFLAHQDKPKGMKRSAKVGIFLAVIIAATIGLLAYLDVSPEGKARRQLERSVELCRQAEAELSDADTARTAVSKMCQDLEIKLRNRESSQP